MDELSLKSVIQYYIEETEGPLSQYTILQGREGERRDGGRGRGEGRKGGEGKVGRREGREGEGYMEERGKGEGKIWGMRQLCTPQNSLHAHNPIPIRTH